jgi:hypothetical protein
MIITGPVVTAVEELSRLGVTGPGDGSWEVTVIRVVRVVSQVESVIIIVAVVSAGVL